MSGIPHITKTMTVSRTTAKNENKIGQRPRWPLLYFFIAISIQNSDAAKNAKKSQQIKYWTNANGFDRIVTLHMKRKRGK